MRTAQLPKTLAGYKRILYAKKNKYAFAEMDAAKALVLSDIPERHEVLNDVATNAPMKVAQAAARWALRNEKRLLNFK